MITEENIETVYNLGGLGYSIEKCALILGVELDALQKEQDNPSSQFSKAYKKGQHPPRCHPTKTKLIPFY